MLRRFHEDLKDVGLRKRRQHDARRTFISIARADGARPDILRWATHGPTGDIVDDYTTLPWPALCEEVAKVRVSVLEGKVIAMPLAATGTTGAANATNQPASPRKPVIEVIEGDESARAIEPPTVSVHVTAEPADSHGSRSTARYMLPTLCNEPSNWRSGRDSNPTEINHEDEESRGLASISSG